MSPETVEHFLEDFRTDPDVLKSDSKAIAKFIRASAVSGDLTDWTVALVSVDDEETKGASIGGLGVGLVMRKLLAPNGTLTIKRIVNPADETLDLTDEERARALAVTVDRWREAGVATRQPSVPVGWAVRQQRTHERGLLLLYPLSIYDAHTSVGPVVGLAVSFPSRGVEREIEYVVNQVHLANEFGWEDEA